MKLAAAGNTEIPAILVLESKGYKIILSEAGDWSAFQADNEFIASSPVELLGLVGIYSQRGAESKASDLDIQRCLKQYF